MKTPAKITLLVAALIGNTAAADECPPSRSDFDAWGWTESATSGDGWMNGIICRDAGTRNAARDLVVRYMGLEENWDYWEEMVPVIDECRPDTWAGRLVDGGYAAEYVSINRDNDTFDHRASPGATYDGREVTHWLSQWVNYHVADEGFDWECLADDDPAGPDGGWIFASNPWSNSAVSLYYPWFWNETVMARAGTLVHEASHEFAPHIDDDECGNHVSCDDAFMHENAQTFQVIFDAQSVDAYQVEQGGRELKVVNYGSNVCGYLPLLPDQDRFAQVQHIRNKLGKCFQHVPPQGAWPSAAFIDTVKGSIYDVAAQPNGAAGQAYRIDIVNQAMWPCGTVCNPDDYTWAPEGGGPLSCNEEYQDANADVNAENRQMCLDLNAQVAAGVTRAEHAILLGRATNARRGCIPGLSEHYLFSICDQAIRSAGHVDDIEANWGIPDDLGYAYEAEQAIRACQARFCQSQPVFTWSQEASAACFEWDDLDGCMALDCGDLPTIAAAKGRDSFEYLNALVCRASELGRNIESLEGATDVCEESFDECWIRQEYLPLWQDQLAGGPCWSAHVSNINDPLHRDPRTLIGGPEPQVFIGMAQDAGLLASSCTMRLLECKAVWGAMHALNAKLASLRAGERAEWMRPPLPDPWEDLPGRFDRELADEVASIGAALMEPEADPVPLSRDARLMRVANRPEARVALAELVGQALYFSVGGARLAEGSFAPERIAQYSGESAESDPGGLPVGGFEDEIAALQEIDRRAADGDWQALIDRAGGLDPYTYYADLVALLEARDGESLLAAHDALLTHLEALGP